MPPRRGLACRWRVGYKDAAPSGAWMRHQRHVVLETILVQQSPTKPVSADERLLAAFTNLLTNINNVQVFYAATTDLLEAGKSHVEQKAIKDGKSEFAKPETQELLGTNPLLKHEGFLDLVFKATAKRSVRLSKQVVDSAALVFAHTILDEAFSECCQISFEVAPSDWYSFVEKRKIELGDLKNENLDDLRRQNASEFVSQLCRDSMIERLDYLNKVCAPRLNGETPITGLINRKLLSEFDEVRHRIIHGKPFGQKISEVADQIGLAGAYGSLAMVLVGKAYGLKAGGLLEKECADKQAVFMKAFSGMSQDFPEMTELINDLTKNLGK